VVSGWVGGWGGDFPLGDVTPNGMSGAGGSYRRNAPESSFDFGTENKRHNKTNWSTLFHLRSRMELLFFSLRQIILAFLPEKYLKNELLYAASSQVEIRKQRQRHSVTVKFSLAPIEQCRIAPPCSPIEWGMYNIECVQ